VPLKLSAVLEAELDKKSNLNLRIDSDDENDFLGIPTAIFGPTCDGLDQMCSLESTLLPRCDIGDWLIWENQGAYTHTASFVFNGFTHIPKRTYCII
jgi:diaminopimelate decarboxylase